MYPLLMQNLKKYLPDDGKLAPFSDWVASRDQSLSLILVKLKKMQRIFSILSQSNFAELRFSTFFEFKAIMLGCEPFRNETKIVLF